MGSISNKPRLFGTPHNPPCTRSHQFGALALVIVTFFFTRLFHQSPLTSCTNSNVLFRSDDDVVRFDGGGDDPVSWPLRGYGPHLSLKIYVYDENEIDGLNQLLYGREGKISADSCLKGQWGTQVYEELDSIDAKLEFVLKAYIVSLILSEELDSYCARKVARKKPGKH